MPRRPGRPRADGPSASGRATDEDILAAAAVLFCSVGYASTSTYAIADRAGVRQASLYHHFAGKHEILRSLLLGTVAPSLELAGHLAERGDDPRALLWALCHGDVELLCAGPVNLGALYLLPEVADPRFADFRALHGRLRRRYAELVARCPGVAPGDAVARAGLVLGLVESVILRRRDEPDLAADELAPLVADGALRLLAVREPELPPLRAEGASVRCSPVRPALR